MARIIGNNNDERLIGTSFADRIAGNGGDDFIFGLRGTDRLGGGLGFDNLFGGRDADTFVFISGDTARDQVRDFENDVDTLDVAAWDVAFEDLRFRETDDGHLIVRGNSPGERFIIFNTTRDQITGDDFIF
jgi:serralysin